MSDTGIYGIFDALDGTCLYVGQTKSIKARWQIHRRRLSNGTALNVFQTWFDSVGRDFSRLSFRVLELCENIDKVKNQREIHWFYKLAPRFYGKRPSENETWEHSDLTKERIRSAIKDAFDKVKVTLTCAVCGNEFEARPKLEGEAAFCKNPCQRFPQPRDESEFLKATETELRDMYLRLNLSMREIGEAYGVTQPRVYMRFQELGIPSKPRGTVSSTRRSLPEKKCLHCEVTFIPSKSIRQFCSRSCARRHR